MALFAALALVAAACGGSEPASSSGSPPQPAASPAGPPASASAAPAPATTAPGIRVVILGDSLTAGLGLPADQAYPAVLEARLKAAGFAVTVVNAGVSGDTSAGGLRRLDWALDGGADILVVALGGNDALRGLPAEDLERNLSAIIEGARKKGAAVLLAGMEAPPNLGRPYTTAFHDVYRSLAARYPVEFLPFLLEGVAGVPSLNQRDGIHPNAEGARRVAALLLPLVERMIRQRATS